MLKPVAGSIILEPLDIHPEEVSGIIVPGRKILFNSGRVVEIGPDKGKVKCPVKVGDSVIFRRFAEQRFTHEKKEYMFLYVKDLMGVYGN